MRRFAKVHVLFLNTARAISKSTRIITLSTAMVHPARAVLNRESLCAQMAKVHVRSFRLQR